MKNVLIVFGALFGAVLLLGTAILILIVMFGGER